MDVIVEWWETMSVMLKFFYTIAIVSTLALVGQMLLILIGVGDGDADTDFDADGGLHVLSVRTIVASLTGFGWAGVVTLKQGLAIHWVLGTSMVVGAAFLFAVFYLMKTLYGLRYSGTLDYHNAIGVVGTVYIAIPPKMQRPGQVEIMVQGRLRFVTAYTKEDKELPGQSKVKVVELVDQNTLLVEPLE